MIFEHLYMAFKGQHDVKDIAESGKLCSDAFPDR